MLDELSESRPLAKMQEQLEREGAGAGDGSSDGGTTSGGDAAGAASGKGSPKSGSDDQVEANRSERSTTPPGSPSKARKPLLNPHDDELERVGAVRQPHFEQRRQSAYARFCPGYTRAGTLHTTAARIGNPAPTSHWAATSQ